MKNIIFDFDGTIADTFDRTVDIIHENSKKTKYSMTKSKIASEIKTKSLKELIRHYNFPRLLVPFMIWKGRRELRSMIDSTLPFKGIPELLKALHKKHRLFMLTSNSKMNTEPFLKKHNLDCFEHKEFKSALLKKDRKILKLIKKRKLKLNDTFYIGDESRDVDACKRINCRCIAVTWGYNSKRTLIKSKPDYLADNPKDILKIIQTN